MAKISTIRFIPCLHLLLLRHLSLEDQLDDAKTAAHRPRQRINEPQAVASVNALFWSLLIQQDRLAAVSPIRQYLQQITRSILINATTWEMTFQSSSVGATCHCLWAHTRIHNGHRCIGQVANWARYC